MKTGGGETQPECSTTRAMAQGCVNDDLRADGLQKGWGFWVGTWNVDSLTRREGEVLEALSNRKADVAYIQETPWKGGVRSSIELKAQNISCFGWEVRSDRVEIFIAEKWVDSVVSVGRHSERVLILKMVLDARTHARTHALSREFRVTLLWELLYMDDLVVSAETEHDLIKRLNEWKDNVENRGMRVNMNRTKVENGRR